MSHLICLLIGGAVGALAMALAAATKEDTPRNKGRWIEDGEICGIDKYKCSLCGGEVGGLLDNTKYCCFCGARMEGGADNAR